MKTHNLTNMEIGDTVTYHIGNLTRDRENSRAVNDIAKKAWKMSCATDRNTYDLGTCELELKQQRIGTELWAYKAKRIK